MLSFLDMSECEKCPHDQSTYTDQTHCFKKVVTLLTYEDPLGLSLACLTLCFFALTDVVLCLLEAPRYFHSQGQ